MDRDSRLVDQVARDAIGHHGDDAVATLRECAELADHLGDILAAEGWRDIADAVERLLWG